MVSCVSLKVSVSIGLCNWQQCLFIVACLGQCYQRQQLGEVCQEDPVPVGIIEKGGGLSPILFLDRVNEFSLLLSTQCRSMFERLICPCQSLEKSLFVLTLAQIDGTAK